MKLPHLTRCDRRKKPQHWKATSMQNFAAELVDLCPAFFRERFVPGRLLAVRSTDNQAHFARTGCEGRDSTHHLRAVT